MKVNYIHNFNQSTEKEFLNIQNSLKQKINITNKIDIENIKVCAGFLALGELPLILEAVKNTVEPDVFIFDCN